MASRPEATSGSGQRPVEQPARHHGSLRLSARQVVFKERMRGREVFLLEESEPTPVVASDEKAQSKQRCQAQQRSQDGSILDARRVQGDCYPDEQGKLRQEREPCDLTDNGQR